METTLNINETIPIKQTTPNGLEFVNIVDKADMALTDFWSL